MWTYAVCPSTFKVEGEGTSGCLLPALYQPTAHINYESRHWNWEDSLPKYQAFPEFPGICPASPLLTSDGRLVTGLW